MPGKGIVLRMNIKFGIGTRVRILCQLMIGDKERLIGFTVGKAILSLITQFKDGGITAGVRNQQMHAHHRLHDVIRKNLQLGLFDGSTRVQQQGGHLRQRESCDFHP